MKSKKPVDCRASSSDFSVLTDFLCGSPKEVSDERKFKDAANGYGFDEIEQEAEGIYCHACMVSHKRPTKMYENAYKGHPSRVVMCKSGVIRFYWQQELSE